MRAPEASEEVAGWSRELGLPIKRESVPSMEFVVASDFGPNSSFQEMDEVLQKLTSYNVYLSSQRAVAIAKLGIAEAEFEQELNSATEKMVGQKFRTYEERRALAINMSGRLQELQMKVVKLRAKVARIKDLPRSIEVKIEVLRDRYRRMVHEARGNA